LAQQPLAMLLAAVEAMVKAQLVAKVQWLAVEAVAVMVAVVVTAALLVALVTAQLLALLVLV
jgi:hypothetical protein